MKKDYFVITRITALAAMAFALSACPPPPTTVNETKCEADIDCETGLICVSNVCKEYLSCNLKQNGCQGSCDDTAAVGKKCATSGNCKTGQVCLDGACAEKTPCAGDEFGRETEVACECKKLGCRVANDCSPGQQCYDSVCKEPESVAADTCEIMNDQLVFALNPAALATAGPAIKINAVGFKSGVVVPYLRANSVAAATTMRFEVAPGTTDSIRVKANAVAGSELITASFGGVTCTRSFTVARPVSLSGLINSNSPDS